MSCDSEKKPFSTKGKIPKGHPFRLHRWLHAFGTVFNSQCKPIIGQSTLQGTCLHPSHEIQWSFSSSDDAQEVVP